MMVVMAVVVVVVVFILMVVVLVVVILVVMIVLVVLGGGVSLESCRINTGRFAITRCDIHMRMFHIKQSYIKPYFIFKLYRADKCVYVCVYYKINCINKF